MSNARPFRFGIGVATDPGDIPSREAWIAGHNDRFIGLLRGTISSREQAPSLVNQDSMAELHTARAAGHLSHEVYFRLAHPGAPESRECLAIDGWFDLEGMVRYDTELEARHTLDGLFTAPPATWELKHPAGDWIKW